MLKLNLRTMLTRPQSAVGLLIAAATGAVLFTVLAGSLVYWNTRSLIASSEWVHHTEKVIASLQQASLLTERIEYRSRLYVLTKNEEQLSRARASANQLDTMAAHLRTLVSDSEFQVANLQVLDSCSRELNDEVIHFAERPAVSDVHLQECHQVIGLMLDHEQSLLLERNKGSQRSSFNSIWTEIGFVILSLVTLVVLFGFLLRDAVLPAAAGQADDAGQ